MKLNKDKIIALTGTILIHAILILILLFYQLKSNPQKQEEGVFVNIGNIDAAAGLFEPEGNTNESKESSKQSTLKETKRDESMETQDIEESISLEKKKELEEKEKEKQRIENEKRIKAEKERKATEIRNKTATVFGKSRQSVEKSQGDKQGTGNQGNTEGDLNSTRMEGGGSGYGNFSLRGRSVNGMLPRPVYSIQEEGTVVIRISVAPDGNVISAEVALQGTNTDSESLRNAALKAAKKAKFNKTDDNNNQTGTITYKFKLK